MKISRRSVLQTMLAAPALSLGGGPLFAQTARPKLRFGAASPVPRPHLSYLYAGTPAGYYEKLGFDAEYEYTNGSSAVLQLLLANEIDIANVGLLDFIAAKKKQPTIPATVVYNFDYASPYVTAVLASSPYKSMADLKGKTVGVLSLGSGSVPTVKAMARQAGIDPASIDLVPVGAGAQVLAALTSGRVDALNYFVGTIADFESRGIEIRRFVAPVAAGAVVVKKSLLESKRDLAVRAMQGLVLNSVLSQDNPLATARGFYKFTKAPLPDDKVLRADAHAITRVMESHKRKTDQRQWGALTDAEWKALIDFSGPELGFTLADTAMADYFDQSLIADTNKVDLSLAEAAAKTL